MEQVKAQLDACEKVQMDLTNCAKAWEVAQAKAVASKQKWRKDLKKMRDFTLKCFHEAKQRMLWP
jgi:hypothetical protein